MTKRVHKLVTYESKPVLQHYIYFGMKGGVIRWVGAGKEARIQEAKSGNHTATVRYGLEFDEVVYDPDPLTKAQATSKEIELIELLGIQLINKQHNSYRGVPAAKSLNLPVTLEDRRAAGLEVD